MILRFMIFFFCVCSIQSAGAQDTSPVSVSSPTLVFDEYPVLTIPRNFRTAQSTMKASQDGKIPSTVGLDTLQIAGSAQFSNLSLQGALKQLKGRVWIIDLRRESHCFINGLPISWYAPGNRSNEEESDDNIMRMEEMLTKDIGRQKGLVVYQILDKKSGQITKARPINLKIESVQTEVALANQHNLGYLRLGVTDHFHPTDAVVDSFVDFVKTLPDDAWLYFHCRAGKGRTTTFMIMMDMLKNGRQVSFEDILKRQYLIGGLDLTNIDSSEAGSWKKQFVSDRLEFIKAFYAYATDKKGFPNKTWSEWRKTAPKWF